jgi:peptidyl-prolyl cis-trans isomerase B (cyclophilin B)
MLPLRLVLESVGLNLSWDASTLNVAITTPSLELFQIIPGTITMADGGIIRFELYPQIAPQSVVNFIYLARQGFYDGLTFHRIISGFMIQGGCPEGTGRGGPGYSIFGEFAANGFENNLLHTRGVLSMARASDFNSGGSQFFIMHADTPFLDGYYAAFGRVVEGLDVVDEIAATPNNGPNGSVSRESMPVIESITIDLDTVFSEPDKLIW